MYIFTGANCDVFDLLNEAKMYFFPVEGAMNLILDLLSTLLHLLVAHMLEARRRPKKETNNAALRRNFSR